MAFGLNRFAEKRGIGEPRKGKKQQVPPLRYAPVGMTILGVIKKTADPSAARDAKGEAAPSTEKEDMVDIILLLMATATAISLPS